MQQTKSYLRFVALAGVVTAFVASACVVTTSTDDDTAGASGSSTAGAAGAGAGAGGATAGAGGAITAGTGGASAGTAGTDKVPYACDVSPDAPAGTANVCTPDADHMTDICALCVQDKCCAQYSACFAYNPGDQCGYGGPNDDGEITCVQKCIQDGVADSGVFDSTLVGTCGAKCTTQKAPNGTSSQECGSVIGYRTSDLVDCLSTNCQTQCFGG